MKYRLQSILKGVAGLSLVPALILSCPAKALSCHIEYSDWLINGFRQQGMSLDNRVRNHTSLTEFQAAMRQPVYRSGDPSLLCHSDNYSWVPAPLKGQLQSIMKKK